MHKKIKAILIGPNKNQLDPIAESFNVSYYESRFEIVPLKDDKNLIKDLFFHPDFDVIVTFGDMTDSMVEDWYEWCCKKWPTLSKLGQNIINKWIVVDSSISKEDLGEQILSKFYNNIRNFSTTSGLVSIITPCYRTDREWFMRMYKSIINQTYQNFEWIILDDSGENVYLIESHINEVRDFRIRLVKNVTYRGNVGYNKRMLGMIAQGEYILELDHDDELTEDCLEYVVKAFETYPDVGFVYSDALELMGKNASCFYGEGYAWGQGHESKKPFNGLGYNVTPDINSVSIRTIIGAPNHVRVWRKTVYDKINGHNSNLSIVDDFELIVRTFLVTKFCYIPKVLYIQHREHETTQYTRNAEIQRINELVKQLYDQRIHDRIIELGHEDLVWKGDHSEIQIDYLLPQKFNYTLEIEENEK